MLAIYLLFIMFVWGGGGEVSDTFSVSLKRERRHLFHRFLGSRTHAQDSVCLLMAASVYSPEFLINEEVLLLNNQSVMKT